MSGFNMPDEDVRKKLEEPFVPDNLLSAHEFRQEGQALICIDDPSLTAVLPLGVYLFGERGSYELKKLF